MRCCWLLRRRNCLSYTLVTCLVALPPYSAAEITENPSEGLTAGPLSEDNVFEWEAYIMFVRDARHSAAALIVAC